MVLPFKQTTTLLWPSGVEITQTGLCTIKSWDHWWGSLTCTDTHVTLATPQEFVWQPESSRRNAKLVCKLPGGSAGHNHHPRTRCPSTRTVLQSQWTASAYARWNWARRRISIRSKYVSHFIYFFGFYLTGSYETSYKHNATKGHPTFVLNNSNMLSLKASEVGDSHTWCTVLRVYVVIHDRKICMSCQSAFL